MKRCMSMIVLDKKNLRIQLGILTAATLQKGMRALGIDVPEQM